MQIKILEIKNTLTPTQPTQAHIQKVKGSGINDVFDKLPVNHFTKLGKHELIQVLLTVST
jgi:hypothetical protein